MNKTLLPETDVEKRRPDARGHRRVPDRCRQATQRLV